MGNLPATWGKVKQSQAFPGLTVLRPTHNFPVSLRSLFEDFFQAMNDPVHAHSGWRRAAVLVAALLLGAAGCSKDPFAFNWDDTPDTVLLYSLARPELNLVSAFDFFQGVPVRIEGATATGTWDAAVDTEGGQIVLAPPGVFGITSTARIATLEGMGLDDVTRAPADTLVYVADARVPVRQGNVYVVKTNRSRGRFGRSCVYYAKLEPLLIDAPGGTLTFRYITNPVCNSKDLVPPK